jgi:hypothetical protein
MRQDFKISSTFLMMIKQKQTSNNLIFIRLSKITGMELYQLLEGWGGQE